MWRYQVATPTTAAAAVGGVMVVMVKGIGLLSTRWEDIEGTGGGRFMRGSGGGHRQMPLPIGGCM